jgi:hypothetical protein
LRRLLVAGAIIVLAATGCGGESEDAGAATDPARLSLPEQIVGLRVVPEDVKSELKGIERPFVDTVAVFSLREDDLLRASLQVSRFNSAARPEDPEFTRSIAGTIGGSSPLEFRVGGKDVFATAASDQVVFTWFEGEGMFVLAVQQDFEFPRSLLRRLLDSEVKA